MTKYFGTDGIRGAANSFLSPELALSLGKAAATVFAEANQAEKILIGKDTRISGSMLEQALAAGIMSAGLDVIYLGIIPTPGVAALCRLYNCPGVVISASHNPYYDNGIKFFAAEGCKISDQIQQKMEDYLLGKTEFETSLKIGQTKLLLDAGKHYSEFILAKQNPDLSGLKVVIDCANGAAFQIAPQVLSTLGAQVTAIYNSPDGQNINLNCGSTHIEALQAAVIEHQADLGLAFDGDADRLLAVDEQGQVVDGDLIMAIIALDMKAKNNCDKLVVTEISNMGLRLSLAKAGLEIAESKVGDRYVAEVMNQTGAKIGGEQSGHLILSDYNNTGDALVAAIYLLTVLSQAKQPLSAYCADIKLFPQYQINIKVNDKDWQIKPKIVAEKERIAQILADSGRILLRASGTEPVIRVMTEGPDFNQIKDLAEGIALIIKAELS